MIAVTRSLRNQDAASRLKTLPRVSAVPTPTIVNHFCTYFDRHFLVQGLALASSLWEYEDENVLWVLCLDEFTEELLRRRNDPRLRPIGLSELEAFDPALADAKSNRTKVEYYFTLSPCWPRYLLKRFPEIDRITYIDSDLFFFSNTKSIFAEMGAASVLVTEHRHPPHLSHHLRCGRFNVGILSFRNDDAGRACLEDWRRRCLAWCHDRVEDGKYADQKYLDQWPAQLGARLHIVKRPGVNLAPWNWASYHYQFTNGELTVDGYPVELFHFARFRPTVGTRWFQSGQLEYGVMPWRLRQYLYGRYWRALEKERRQLAQSYPTFCYARKSSRNWHGFWRALVPRILFGSDWLRIGSVFISGRLGLGRYSGQALSQIRTWTHAHAAEKDPAGALPADETITAGALDHK